MFQFPQTIQAPQMNFQQIAIAPKTVAKKKAPAPTKKSISTLKKKVSAKKPVFVPSVEVAPKDWKYYKQALKEMGFDSLNDPSDLSYYELTHEVEEKINKKYKGGKGVMLKFLEDEFDEPNMSQHAKDASLTDKDKAWGKYINSPQRQVHVWTQKDKDIYKFILAHELGHARFEHRDGAQDNEFAADAFAREFYPTHYTYKNNPWVKESWQPGYVAPNPLPVYSVPQY